MRTLKMPFFVFICFLYFTNSAYSQFTPNSGTPTHYYSTYPNANIGIGSAFNASLAPSEKLHIKNGNLKIENTLTDQGGTTVSSYLLGARNFTTQIQFTAGIYSMDFSKRLTLSSPYDITYLGGFPGTNGEVGMACTPAAGKDMFITNTGNSNLRIYCNAAERVRVDPAGKVTIYNQLVIGNAVSSDASKPTLSTDYKLYVEKGIITEKVKTAVNNTADWADHVFAPHYQLRTISEMEKYVTEHKHLPGVPSAEQVVKEGIDLAKMDAKLLEKIEEMALYIIQLKKENEKILKEVEALKSSK